MFTLLQLTLDILMQNITHVASLLTFNFCAEDILVLAKLFESIFWPRYV